MKKVKFTLLALISMLIVIPLNTLAETIVNNNGIEISEEDYNNFLKIRTHEYIMTMDLEDYNKLKSLDYNNITTDTRYIETVYNPHLLLTTEKEITEEQFNNPVMPILNTKDGYIETLQKKLTLTLAGGSYWNYVVLTATWKGTPGTRSFDVIGLLFDGADIRNGSQTGEQVYSEDGKYYGIDYAWNGTNIKRFSDGFGISMNVVNNKNLGSLQFSIDCDITPTENYTYIYGSYQHAVTTVSLEDSQKYEINTGGLGRVFSFPLSISQKYDGMSGVSLDYD